MKFSNLNENTTSKLYIFQLPLLAAFSCGVFFEKQRDRLN